MQKALDEYRSRTSADEKSVLGGQLIFFLELKNPVRWLSDNRITCLRKGSNYLFYMRTAIGFDSYIKTHTFKA